MKIRVVSSKDEILTLRANETIVHLTFRPSAVDIFTLVDVCPKLEVIQLPKSYHEKVSKSMDKYFKSQHIQVVAGEVWGHRKDLSEYYEVPKFVLERVQALKSGGVPVNEIVDEIVRKHRLSREQAELVVKE